MENKVNFHKITDFMTLVVFTLLAVCILSVLVTGAGIYNRLTAQGSAQYDSRTLCRYLTTRIHQGDAAGELSLEQFHGSPAIVLREELGEDVYITRIYCYDGYLRELYTPETGNYSPEDGEKLLPAQALTARCQENLLLLELTLPQGTPQELILCLRSRGGIVP